MLSVSSSYGPVVDETELCSVTDISCVSRGGANGLLSSAPADVRVGGSAAWNWWRTSTCTWCLLLGHRHSSDGCSCTKWIICH